MKMKKLDGIATKGKTETKQVKMAMGGGMPMMANKMMGGGMPQAPGRTMPQAPGKTMPQALGRTMPQAGNKPTALPSGATPYGNPVQMAPKGGIADEGPGGLIVGQRGPQTGGPGLANPMSQSYQPPSDRFAYKKGGSIKTKKGGSVKSKSKSASSRGDGIAQRGKTRA